MQSSFSVSAPLASLLVALPLFSHTHFLFCLHFFHFLFKLFDHSTLVAIFPFENVFMCLVKLYFVPSFVLNC
jgi:hypothetical protein